MYARTLLAVAAVFLLCFAAGAHAATPVPPFPADHVAVAEDVDDVFDPLRARLAERQSAVGAEYHVAVVGLSDPEDRDGAAFSHSAVPYVDEVYASWARQIDPRRGIVIAMAIDNRGIAVHPGSQWARLGFEQAAIKRVIDASAFASYARAHNYSGALEALVVDIDRELARLQRAHATHLREARTELSALGERTATLRERVDDLELEHADLASLDGTLEMTSVALDAGRLDVAERHLERARRVLDETEARVDAAETTRRWLTVYLPLLALVILLLVLYAVWSSRRVLRIDLRSRAEDRLRYWEDVLRHASHRLLTLEDEHPFLMASDNPRARFSNETDTALREIGGEVDTLFLQFDAAQQRASEARRTLEAAGRFLLRDYHRVLALLSSEPIEVGVRTTDRRQLFVPEREPITHNPDALLASMEARYAEVCDRFAALDTRITAGLERADTLAHIASRWEAALHRLAAHHDELPDVIGNAQDEQRRLAARAALLRVDPVAAQHDPVDIDAAVERARLVEHCADISDALAGPLTERLTTVRRRVDHLRAEHQLVVLEPGFEPDATQVDAHDHLRAAALAAGRLEADRAETHARAADALAARLAEQLDILVDSHAHGAQRWADLDTRRETLHRGLPEHRALLDALRERHADAALLPALDNIAEAEALFEACRDALAHAQRDLEPDTQRYLAAAELMRRVERSLDEIAALYDELEHRGELLDEVAAETRAHIGTLSHKLETHTALLADDEQQPVLTTDERRLAEATRDHLQTVIEAACATRPDWLTLRQQARDCARHADALATRFEQQRAAHDAVIARHPGLAEQLETLEQQLAASDDDREQANQAARTARRHIDTAAHALARPEQRHDWITLDAGLDAAGSLIAQSEAQARQDFDVAAQARKALADAIARRRSLLEGDHARFVEDRGFDKDLERARRHLAQREYEAVPPLTVAAVLAITQEVEGARTRAIEAWSEQNRWRERWGSLTEEMERAPREAMSRSLSNSGSSSSLFGSSSSSSSSLFGSSSSSGSSLFGSSSSSGSSSSGGSSWGGSSSGGSSWGGSSSGGSSW